MYKPKYLLLIILILALTTVGMAQSYMSARSISMSGAYSTNSRGVNTIGWNPANLGYNDNPNFAWKFFMLPFIPATSFELKNNSISPYWLENEFLVGELLNDNDKQSLLNYFPETGLQVYPVMNIDLLSMSFGHWAFSFGVESISNVTIPKNLFNFVFYGNQFDEPIDLSGLDLESQTMATFTLYHGREIKLGFLDEYVKQFNVGAGLKFLSGASYIDIEKMDASITITQDETIVDGHGLATGAVGGYGFALDAGMSAQITDQLYSSLSFHNLGGKINWGNFNLGIFDDEMLWNHSQENGDIVEAVFDIHSEIHKSNFENADSLIEEGITTDTTYIIDNYSTSYPAYMNMGVEYRLLDNLTFTANYQQFFTEKLVFNTTPKLSIGTEYYPFPVLPFRAGFSVGGYDNFRWGFGTGLNFKNYTFDFGFAQIGGMFDRAKGMSFTITNMLLF